MPRHFQVRANAYQRVNCKKAKMNCINRANMPRLNRKRFTTDFYPGDPFSPHVHGALVVGVKLQKSKRLVWKVSPNVVWRSNSRQHSTAEEPAVAPATAAGNSVAQGSCRFFFSLFNFFFVLSWPRGLFLQSHLRLGALQIHIFLFSCFFFKLFFFVVLLFFGLFCLNYQQTGPLKQWH